MLKLKWIQNKRFYLLLFFCLAIILLSGCVKVKQQAKTVRIAPLGIFKSEDSGLTWKEKNAYLNTQGKLLTIGDVSINKIIIDPSDQSAIYLATDKGLYYTYSRAEGWQDVPIFGTAPINDIAIDYFDKCNIFVTAGQSIYKSTDCLRTWQEVYFDTRSDLQIIDVEIDKYNREGVVYAANNKGELLKSSDFGRTWQAIKRFDNALRQILIDKDDTRIIYIATESAGLFKTLDAGKTWSDEKPELDINKGLNQFYESKNFHYLVQDMTAKDSFIMASQYGLLKTNNGGQDWQSIELITPERGANIYSVAVDSKDNKIIYYGTDTTLYKSIDSGKTWATFKSPTSGIVNLLLIDQQSPNIIYLGSKAIKK